MSTWSSQAAGPTLGPASLVGSTWSMGERSSAGVVHTVKAGCTYFVGSNYVHSFVLY